MRPTAETLLGSHYKINFHNKMEHFCIFLSFRQKEKILCLELLNYMSKIMQYLFMESMSKGHFFFKMIC